MRATAPLIAAAWVVAGWVPLSRGDSGKGPARDDLSDLATACAQYRVEYGKFPSGKTIEVMHALAGANPRKLTFIEWQARPVDADGGFLDRFGTRYVISFPDRETVEVRSAGADKTVHTADDKYFRNGSRGSDRNG